MMSQTGEKAQKQIAVVDQLANIVREHFSPNGGSKLDDRNFVQVAEVPVGLTISVGSRSVHFE